MFFLIITLPRNKLLFTCFPSDNACFALIRRNAGVPEELRQTCPNDRYPRRMVGSGHWGFLPFIQKKWRELKHTVRKPLLNTTFTLSTEIQDCSFYYSSKASRTSHTCQTLPTRSGPGFKVFFPGFQPEGVASVPPDSLTN